MSTSSAVIRPGWATPTDSETFTSSLRKVRTYWAQRSAFEDRVETVREPGVLGRDAWVRATVFYYSVIEGFDDFAAGDASTISGLSAPDTHTLEIDHDHADRRHELPTGDGYLVADPAR